MGVSPGQGTGFHTTDIQTNILDFGLGILAHETTRERRVAYLAVAQAGNVEHLGALIDFRPETLFESLLGMAKRLALFKGIQVGDHAKYTRETVSLQVVTQMNIIT